MLYIGFKRPLLASFATSKQSSSTISQALMSSAIFRTLILLNNTLFLNAKRAATTKLNFPTSDLAGNYSLNRYWINSRTTWTFTLLPISLYWVLVETVGGHLNVWDDSLETGSSKQNNRKSSLGVKYRSLRSSRRRTASGFPACCWARNSSNTVVVYRRVRNRVISFWE